MKRLRLMLTFITLFGLLSMNNVAQATWVSCTSSLYTPGSIGYNTVYDVIVDGGGLPLGNAFEYGEIHLQSNIQPNGDSWAGWEEKCTSGYPHQFNVVNQARDIYVLWRGKAFEYHYGTQYVQTVYSSNLGTFYTP